MADLPDRQAQPHIYGAAHFSLDHADSTHAASVHEGARGDYPGSISSPPLEQEFESWYTQIRYNEEPLDHIMFPGDHATHASTQSETDSEGLSATSPSGLTAGSSVGTSEGTDEDAVMTDAPTPERPHEDIWPQLSNVDIPPRDPTIQDNDYPIHLAEDHQMSLPSAKLLPQLLDPTAQGGPTPAATRGRRLPCREKTSKVRNIGACLHCRVAKTSCDATPDSPCDECVKSIGKWKCPSDAREICIRKTPYEVVGSLSPRRWCLDTGRPLPSRFGGQTVAILVSFTADTSGPFLQIHARQVEGQQQYGILPGQNPHLEDDMYRWAKRGIEGDRSSSFEPALDRFLMSLEQNRGLDEACRLQNKPNVPLSFVESQKECVRRLLKMKCMWRIWGKPLFFRAREDQAGREMGSSLHFQPVQDYLHQLAGQAVSEAEKDVLKEVDRLLAPISIRKGEYRILWSALNVVAWTSLWQLMLVYRSTLRMFSEGQISKTPTSTIFHSPKRAEFLATTVELYKNVAVLCSGAFRTKRALESLEEAGRDVFANEPFSFPQVWEAHSAFYQSFRVEAPGDELVKSLVADKEGKVLGRKRPSKKL
ncbi:hypothetical protein QBC39DRAFT_368054 [Podospora conica]|nr:hypothetical protein QBC39DRAFT_368054 [Schizothecium conicum]